MISCIICSRRPDISAELKENIASTIGCEYELIVIDNSKNEYSIFSAYNEGVRRAKGNVLCFMHEDIIYHTNDWGPKVLDYFKQYPRAGLIGVAGTHYMPAMPAAQWDSELSSSSMIQGEVINGHYITTNWEQTDYKSTPTLMVAVDGLWMCMPEKMFYRVCWDENVYKGFHCYDTDMAFQTWNAGFEVHLFWDVLIEHQSIGSANKAFVEASEALFRKWKHILPMMKGVSLSAREQKLCDSLCECKGICRISNMRYKEVIASHAYRLGKRIIMPFTYLKKRLYYYE